MTVISKAEWLAVKDTEVVDPRPEGGSYTGRGPWGPLPCPVLERVAAGVARLPSGHVVLLGGYDAHGEITDAIEVFNPAQKKNPAWKAFSPPTLPTRRYGCVGCVLRGASPQLLVLGGADYDDRSVATVDALAIGKKGDGEGDWTSLPPMQQSRQRFGAVVLADGRSVLAVGGVEMGIRLASCELYTAGGAWEQVPPLSLGPREDFGCCVLSDGTVLVAGGVGPKGAVLQSAETYDPVRPT